MNQTVAPTWIGTIWIAGDEADAKRACRAFCAEVGFCVSVTRTTFVYSWGEESGVGIGVINYPRFPGDSHEQKMRALAGRLMDALYQRSCTLVTPQETVWLSRETRAV